ncbi:MAG: polymerase [Ponticaulis sp.]|nr:polymerase [Ponticaulis sp.]
MASEARSHTLLRWIEFVAIGVCLLMFSEALLGRLFATEQNPEGGAFLRFLWLPIYGYAAVAMCAKWRDFLSIFFRSPALLALALMAVASAAWSIDPSTSFRRGIAILFTTFFGFYLATSLTWKELIRLMGVVWLILAVGNMLAGALVPSFGVMHEIHPGAWRGLWFEKNAMGGNFARACFLFGFLLMVDKDRRRVWGFGLFASVVLVLMSTSKTSLLGMMLGFGMIVMYLWMKQGRMVTVATLWLVTTACLSVFMLIVVAPEVLVGLIGRDLTLTGRTDIWAVLFTLVDERPLLGYGYGAFWGEYSTPANRVRMATEWLVPTAHNGIIEIVLALGWIGAGLFLADFALNLVRSLATLSLRVTSLFAFGTFMLFAMFSISESVILQQNSLIWVTYAAVVGKLSLEARDRTKKAAPVVRSAGVVLRPRFSAISD